MNSKTIGLFAAVAIASTASAGVLLWQVPGSSIEATDIYGKSKTIEQSTGDYAWSYAMLKYDTTTTGDVRPDINTASANNNPSLATYWKGESLADNSNHAKASMSGETLSSDFASGDNVHYYIALYNSENQLMGYSAYLQNIQDFTATTHALADWTSANGVSGTGWTAAPEPTSGVLLLLGAAVLGLRRRKVA